MERITHVSFDVWNTLVCSNPIFASKRNQGIASILGKTEAEVKKSYTKIKTIADNDAEIDHVASNTKMLISELCYDLTEITPSDNLIDHIYGHIFETFNEHPPLIEECVIDMLQDLKNQDLTLSIGSNSNFISGKLMYPWLQKITGHAFDFGVFSDLLKVSKPSRTFFEQIKVLSNNTQTPEKILHCGDNIVCDVFGASRGGITPALVNYTTIAKCLPTYLEELNK